MVICSFKHIFNSNNAYRISMKENENKQLGLYVMTKQSFNYNS